MMTHHGNIAIARNKSIGRLRYLHRGSKERKFSPCAYWGKPYEAINLDSAPTQFEKLFGHLTLENCQRSRKFKAWVRAHMNTRYIPESFLLKLGFRPARHYFSKTASLSGDFWA